MDKEMQDHPSWSDGSWFCHDLETAPEPGIGTVLVSGASGYIGGRLVPELLVRGYTVRVMVRAPVSWSEEAGPGTEVVVADALQRESLEKALYDVHTAYYLIHSLVHGPKNFADTDLRAARNFREAADKVGVKRIIYLGGLHSSNGIPSEHLLSRLEVGAELSRGSIPVTIVRAGVIIGSGSASYEIIHHLVRNLPVIFMPKWIGSRCQPVSIRDMIKYLVGVLETPESAGLSLDVGGKDVLTYREMMEILAEILRKKRLFLQVPASNLGLFSYLASLFTPVPVPIIRCLMEGLKNDVICRDDSVKRLLPFEPLGYREAIVRAMTREEQDRVYTRWSDAYPPAHELALKLDELETPPRYTAAYSLLSDKSRHSLFLSVCKVGGREGWFYNNWMWRLRGAVDRLFLGVGTHRGRRSRVSLKVNDVIDFWRVEDLRPDERLLLRSEMKLPGRAWLEFRIEKKGKRNRISVKAYFDTRTRFGKIYWQVFMPFHRSIFRGLIEMISKRAVEGVSRRRLNHGKSDQSHSDRKSR